MNLNSWKTRILGRPLTNSSLEHEKLPVSRALPVFASDALSSVAYATEEILIILAAVSVAATAWGVPIALGIVGLLVIVSTSYRQTIQLYPNGGGAYVVSMKNLGETPGLLAGGALMLDYILTVAVSISAGTAAMASAFPWVGQHAILMSTLLIALMTLANLRGLRESSILFSFPTYFFIIMMFLLLGAGFYRVLTHDPLTETGLKDMPIETIESVGLFMLLKAFSSGCAALTGIEAISNGVPSFKAPSSKNAKRTMTIMVFMLGLFFASVSYFARHYNIVPVANETVLSQIARVVFQNKILYYSMQVATAGILVLAANTAFADFPRLASIMAHDRYLPRQLHNIGDRLVFSNGIVSLGACAIGLVIMFSAETHALVPLYSVGVFLSFTLSQSGMIQHHLKNKEAHWKKGFVINSIGAVATAIVMCVVAITKFASGAWITLVVIPLMLWTFKSIKGHYLSVAKQLELKESFTLGEMRPSLIVMPISGFHSGVLKALEYARGLSSNIHLVVVDLESNATKRIQGIFEKNLSKDPHIHLKVIESPYRSVISPTVDYIKSLQKGDPQRAISVLIPEFVTKKWWHNFLHNQTAFFLKANLRFMQGIVVTSVRYHLQD